MKKSRKRKFVVWLNNFTDRRDDEWVSVFAHTPEEAKSKAEFDDTRFSLGHVMTAKEFRRDMGFGA